MAAFNIQNVSLLTRVSGAFAVVMRCVSCVLECHETLHDLSTGMGHLGGLAVNGCSSGSSTES
jgi:hypothetical protein